MAEKKKKNRYQQTVDEIKSLQAQGFVLAGTTRASYRGYDDMPSDKSAISSMYRNDNDELGTELLGFKNIYDCAQTQRMPTPDKVGSPKKGYIKWGVSDRLPLRIYRAANDLPYTATGLKYLVDLMYGLGPRLMYKYVRYAGQNVSEELIPYEQAGVLLRHLIMEARTRLATTEGQSGKPADDGYLRVIGVGNSASSDKSEYRTKAQTEEPAEPEFSPDSIGTPEDELDRLINDYRIWETTNNWYSRFREENDIDAVYQQCCMDDTFLDISFPTLGLNQGETGRWDAKVMKVGVWPAMCSRLEEMDDNLNINYVYYAEKLRNENTAELQRSDFVAFPTLMSKNMLPRLRATVEAYQHKSVKSRPKWFCCPQIYPSGSRPYYPQPAWWSIFSSLVYNYASTLVTDKAIARKNATMWGKLIFINLNYLKELADQQGITDPVEVDKMKNQIIDSIDQFLRDRKNNGKTCTLESYIGPDGHTVIDSVKLVDVPGPAKSTATEAELKAVADIVFFALGINPALVGVTIGSGSNGGTFQRELHLLKQQQMAPRQRRQLTFWNRILQFNRLDPHAEWVVKMPILTTLDRSATGLVETESE